MDTFKIILPLKNEYITTVRLTTGGICFGAEFDVDETEDFKLCITESLLILKRNGFNEAEISFEQGEALTCKILGLGICGKSEEKEGDDISFALLNALIGNVQYTKDDCGKIIEIQFKG